MEPGDMSIENGEDPRPSNYIRKDAWFAHVHLKEEERNYQSALKYKTRVSTLPQTLHSTCKKNWTY